MITIFWSRSRLIRAPFKVAVTAIYSLIFGMMSGCGGGSEQGPGQKLIAEIHFQDDALNACVRATGAQWVADLISLDCNSVDNSAGLEQLTHLKHLVLGYSRIPSLDLGSNPDLETLHLSSVNLQNLDLSNNSQLTELEISDHQLPDLDLSGNPKLRSLFIRDLIGGLDLSNHQQLERLDLSGAEAILPTPSNLKYFKLSTSYTKNIDFSKQNKLEELILFTVGIGDNLDISHNQALRRLTVSTNGELFGFIDDVTKVDISQNPNLEYVNLANNKLSSLDISNNHALEYLDLNNNQLTALDSSANKHLRTLRLFQNRLSNYTGGESLEILAINGNNLTELNLLASKKLVGLSARGNNLSYIDLSSNHTLQYLDLSNNQLADVNLETLTELRKLSLGNNAISTIDLAGLSQLKVINLRSNQLQNVDLSDQKRLVELYLLDNPGTCPNATFQSKVSFAPGYREVVFAESVLGCTNIPSSVMGGTPIDSLEFADGNLKECVNRAEKIYAEEVIALHCSGVKDLRGIEQLSELKLLELTGGEFDLNLSKNTKIETLRVYTSLLKSIDLSGNTSLKYLSLGYPYNSVNYLNLEALTELVSLDITGVYFEEVVLGDMPGLVHLQLARSNDSVVNLNLSHYPMLRSLSLNNFDGVDLSQNQKLRYLRLVNVSFDPQFLRVLPDLINLDAQRCSLSEIDLSNNPHLEMVNLQGNQLTNINLQQQPDLKTLILKDNKLSELRLDGNPSLQKLDVSNNELSQLNLTDNTSLSDLDALDNPLIQLDLNLTGLIHTAYFPTYEFSLKYLQELEKADGRPFGQGYRFGL